MRIEETKSPFLNLVSYPENKADDSTDFHSHESENMENNSPFQSIYELEGHQDTVDPDAEEFISLVDGLYDQEFEDAMEELQNEALGIYEDEIIQNHSGIVEREAAYHRVITERFSPLFQEVDNVMDQFIAQAERYDQKELTESEFSNFMDQFESLMQEESPVFEYGWWSSIKKAAKSVVKKVKKVAGKAVKLAKKLGFGWVLKRIKNYLKKYFKSFLSKIYKRLPSSLRKVVDLIKNKVPGVKKYYNKYKKYRNRFFKREYLQQELDISLSAFLLAPNENEMERIYENFLSEEIDVEEENNSVEMLDEARETFIRQLSELEAGGDPGPAIENFIAALRTALKIGVKIIGRSRVEKFIAKVITRLIKRYVGKRKSRWIAKKLAKYGLRLLTGELTPEQEVEYANRALVATIENTAKQVLELSEEAMEDEAVFESQIMQSFENAAAANLVDLLPEVAYEQRPELRETERKKAFWKVIKKGKKRKFCRYKKYQKIIKTELSPYIAQQIKSFDGTPISSVLESQLGLSVQSNIPVKVHLYEMMHGGKLFHISKYEKRVPGLGNSKRQAWQQIHPLTSVAAGLLFGEPGLGCKASGKCLHSNTEKNGHRYYYLEFPGHHQQSMSNGIEHQISKATNLDVKLDFVQNKLCLFLYLSEKEGHILNQQLEKQLFGFAIRNTLTQISSGLKNAFKYHSKVRVVHPSVLPGIASGQALSHVPQIVLDQLRVGTLRWVDQQLSSFYKDHASMINRTVLNKGEGISIEMRIDAPKNMDILKQYIAGKATTLSSDLFNDNKLNVDIKVKAGHDFS